MLSEFRHGIDPQWNMEKGVYQFYDPICKKNIGYWDTSFSLAFFYGRGFLKKNPNNKQEYCFSFDPLSSPYKENRAVKTKRGVLQFTESFDLDQAIQQAPPLVEKVIQARSLRVEGFEDEKANCRALVNAILKPYLAQFHKTFKFNWESLELKLWPGKEEGTILLQRLELMSPGLTMKLDQDTGEHIPLPIQEAFFKKLGNERTLHRNHLEKDLKGKNWYWPSLLI